MGKTTKLQCPSCNSWVKGGNSQLASHMMNRRSCKETMKTCLGCSRLFANQDHLDNHHKQKSGLSNNYCMHGIKKLEHVQRMKLILPGDGHEKINSTKQVFVVEQPTSLFNPVANYDNSNSCFDISDESIPNLNQPVSYLESNVHKFTRVLDGLNTANHQSKKKKRSLSDSNINPNQNKNKKHQTLSLNPICDYTGIANTGFEYHFKVNSDEESSFESYSSSFNKVYGNKKIDYSSDIFSTLIDSTGIVNVEVDLSNNEVENSTNHERNNIHPVDQKPHSNYIIERIKFNSIHRQQTSFSYLDKALIDLYNRHRKTGAPVGEFDNTVDWLKQHTPHLFETSGNNVYPKLRPDVSKRKEFIRTMYEKVYGKGNVQKVRPKLVNVQIDDQYVVPATEFDFREVLVDMLSNEDIMNPNHLQFYDNSDPTKIHPQDTTNVGEIVTSDTFFRAHKRLCNKPDDVLWPLIIYNDELNFDKYGKLKLDPLSMTFGRLPLHIRNQPFAWRMFGIVHSIKYFDTDKKMDSTTKMKIYHKVLHKLLRIVKEIQKEGGIPFDLPQVDGSTKRVNLIIYVQFIIGDTKGHDLLCGRMGSYHLGMNQLLRDCCVAPNDSDNIPLKCNFRKLADVQNFVTEEDFRSISFKKIDNAFHDLEMGDEVHGIFGATNGEPLHILEMQLLELISQVFTDSLHTQSQKTLTRSIINIVNTIDRQSISSEFPKTTAFREGLTKVKNLTGKERHARLFAIYLALMSSDVIATISNQQKKITTEKYVEHQF